MFLLLLFVLSFLFSVLFSKFLLASSCVHSFDFFSKFSSRRRDRFGPKIVKIRAILAIFRPLEDFFGKFSSRLRMTILLAGLDPQPQMGNLAIIIHTLDS